MPPASRSAPPGRPADGRGPLIYARQPAGTAEVLERLEDGRDAAEAGAVLAELRAGKTSTRPWRELRSELGL